MFDFPYKLVALTLLGLSGCAGTGMPAPAAYAIASEGDVDAPRALRSNRVIVKFNDSSLNPAQPEILADLARGIGITLVYIRPISGGAHLLQVTGAVDAQQMQRVVEMLTKKPGVEFAEIDQRMRTMP